MTRSTLTIDHRDKTRGLGIPFMSRYIEKDYNLMTNTTTDIISTTTNDKSTYKGANTSTVSDVESTSKGVDQ